MIVRNTGYVKPIDLESIGNFSIYETHKETHILIKDINVDRISIYRPKEDRLPWKVVEDQHICTGNKVFDSKTQDIKDIDFSKWNNGNQIMSYEEYSLH